ncbi:uncharacterized protein LOC143914804 [Arctopsyche grandis]|uniref:uncharacterized protein LOC143914804 n=1 Tax=Arctopsyche grandis TaxID=121162 RepID=UPI00406D66CC
MGEPSELRHSRRHFPFAMRNTMLMSDFRNLQHPHIPDPPDPWERRDKHRKEIERENFGYFDSYMNMIINSLDGYVEKDNKYIGKIDDKERDKIVKMEFPLRAVFVILQRAVYDGYEVRPGIDSMHSEITDLFIYRTNENGEQQKRYINMQLSTSKKDETVNSESLFTNQLTMLSLARCFIDYREKKRILDFNEYVLCTNSRVESESSWEGIFKVDPKADWVFDVKDFSQNYKIDKRQLSKIKPKVRACFQRVLARRLVKCLFEKKEVKNDVNSVFLKDYVIDVEKSKFREDFIQNRHKENPLPIDIKPFRDYIIIEMQERNESLDLEKIFKSNMKFILEENFGTNKSPHLGVRGHIDDKELDQFLDEFLISANMPDDYKIIKYCTWIMSTSDLEIVKERGIEKVIFKDRMKHLRDWLRSDAKEDITTSQEIRDILKEKRINVTNWFPSVEPLHYLVGRDNQLREIRKCFEENKLVVITGIGGIGKSQLVNMYIKQYGRFIGDNIIWIYGKDPVKIIEQFRGLARNGMCAFTADQEKSKTVDEIMRAVVDYYNGTKCLLVFDDAEPFIFDKIEGHQEKYLPDDFIKRTQPNILITSRKRTWNQIGNGHIMRLGPYFEKESREVIIRNVDLRLNRRQARLSEEIGKRFDYFPLVIYQMITYINRRCRLMRNVDHDVSFTMNQMLEEHEKEPLKVLAYKESNMNRVLYSRHIMMTFDPTIEDIQRKEKNGDLAVKLIYLMAFIGDDNVPKDTFLPLVDNNEEDLKDLINVVHEYSMLELVGDDKIFIYQIVRKVFRLKLKADEKDKELFEEAKKLVSCESNISKELKLIEPIPDPIKEPEEKPKEKPEEKPEEKPAGPSTEASGESGEKTSETPL